MANLTQISIGDLRIQVAEAGDKNKPAIVLLHGWPQNHLEFKAVMGLLQDEYYVISPDLPGIGGSTGTLPSDKITIAKTMHELITHLGVQKPLLAGHDAGGMIAYAYLKTYPDELTAAVIMDTAIPGVAPWEQVKSNPYIWHFAFHGIKQLPETLVADHIAEYFDFFYNILAANPSAISAEARNAYRQAYSRPESLRTGFDWYRAFPQDEKDNQALKDKSIATPLLYLRGDKEYGNLEDYLKGFREQNLQNVRGEIIKDCGHFAPEEQPAQVAELIKSC